MRVASGAELDLPLPNGSLALAPGATNEPAHIYAAQNENPLAGFSFLLIRERLVTLAAQVRVKVPDNADQGRAYKLQIKGLIRFSYLTEGGFAISEQGEEIARKTIYNPDRLLRRFALFENLTLRSLKLQTNAAFQMGVLIGDDFPRDAAHHLATLLADVPQARIIRLPRMVHYRATRIAFEKMGDDPEATHTATLRLDDDDAIHKDWMAHIAAAAPALSAARGYDAPMVIAANRGFYFDLSNPQNPISEWYEKHPISVGSTLIAPRSTPENIYLRNHRKLPEFYDCFTSVSAPMFLRSVHQDNDSHALSSGHQGKMRRPEIEKRLRAGFGLGFDDLRRTYVS